MSKPIALDTSPLSLFCYPDLTVPIVDEINRWLRAHLVAGTVVFIPEIADYEVRRELLRAKKQKCIRRLDRLQRTLAYLPLDTAAMRRAAEMWAIARSQGLPTADPKEIDADVILAAQAEQVQAVVATDNVGHLAHFIPAQGWRDIAI